MHRFFKIIAFLSLSSFILGLAGLAAAGLFLWRLGADLPSHEHLANYQPPVMSRVYAANGAFLASYARQRRLFVPIEAMPPHLLHAFLSAEDKNFFNHPGLDARGVLRALLSNARKLLRGGRPSGGSTITQQAARNFFLSQDVNIKRKIKETLLAFRLERTLSKNAILELYLNEIYLGMGTYGVAAAALNYFGKPLNELSLAETAYLAALPKGPNNYHPVRNRERAKNRRDWVLSRMEANGYISNLQRKQAQSNPLQPVHGRAQTNQKARYFAETVRRSAINLYGAKTLYEGGLAIRSTLNPQLQSIAHTALREGLADYDRRHGWRGVIRSLPEGAYWPRALTRMKPPPDLKPWRLAVVLSLSPKGAQIGLRPTPRADQKPGNIHALKAEKSLIPLDEMRWARKVNADGTKTPPINHPSQILQVGDVIYVAPVPRSPHYALRQIPKINGAIVVMNPHTGRVLAMSGGFSFSDSQFNRATQAKRQPGSAFKPFVYAAALDNGLTPSSVLLDIPSLRAEATAPVSGSPKTIPETSAKPTRFDPLLKNRATSPPSTSRSASDSDPSLITPRDSVCLPASNLNSPSLWALKKQPSFNSPPLTPPSPMAGGALNLSSLKKYRTPAETPSIAATAGGAGNAPDDAWRGPRTPSTARHAQSNHQRADRLSDRLHSSRRCPSRNRMARTQRQ